MKSDFITEHNTFSVIYSKNDFWRIVMETKMKKKRRAFVNEDDCVACGCERPWSGGNTSVDV